MIIHNTLTLFPPAIGQSGVYLLQKMTHIVASTIGIYCQSSEGRLLIRDLIERCYRFKLVVSFLVFACG